MRIVLNWGLIGKKISFGWWLAGQARICIDWNYSFISTIKCYKVGLVFYFFYIWYFRRVLQFYFTYYRKWIYISFRGFVSPGTGILFSLSIFTILFALVISVLRGNDLPGLDPSGLSDPYVEVSMQPQKLFPSQRVQRTQVMKQTLNPVFNVTFQL